MSAIKVLPESVYKQIAAGEVIVSPAAAVKELLENAADAEATAITIEIADGGKELIRVTDNGTGMSEQDLPLAIAKHATSKITSFEDVYSLESLGFRGEALSSIAQIARVTITSRQKDSEIGAKLTVEGGGEPQIAPIGTAEGTTVRVQDLFYNVPARQKFLKTGAKEGAQVSETVRRMILSRPDIAFKYIRNGKIVYQSPGDGKLESAISSVYGADSVRELAPVHYAGQFCIVDGLMSKPTYIFKTKQRIDFFVNGRYVQSKELQAALIRGYGESLFHGHYPMSVLNLQVNPAAMDINVHPAKLAIMFTNMEGVEADMSAAVRSVLPGTFGAPFLELEEGEEETGASSTATVSASATSSASSAPVDSATLASAVSTVPLDATFADAASDATERLHSADSDSSLQTSTFFEEEPEPREGEDTLSTEKALESEPADIDVDWEPTKESADLFAQFVEQSVESEEQEEEPDEEDVRALVSYNILGSAFASYIICEAEGRLYFIDQHAARERLTYENLLKWTQEGKKYGQLLLVPVVRTLPEPEFQAFIKNADLLETLGLSLERFGELTLRFNSFPVQIAPSQVDAFLTSILKELKAHPDDPVVARERIISSACRHSVKAGTQLTEVEMQKLMNEIVGMSAIPYCPHGRPIAIEITLEQLEKGFRRRP